MCLLRKRKKQRLQRKLAEMQLKMEEIKKLYGHTEVDEAATVDFLLLNPTGEVSKLLDYGCNPKILESFRTTGVLNIPPNISKNNCYGRYCVTGMGKGMLELMSSLNILSH